MVLSRGWAADTEQIPENLLELLLLHANNVHTVHLLPRRGNAGYLHPGFLRSIAPGGVPLLKLTSLTLSTGGCNDDTRPFFSCFPIIYLLDDVPYVTTLRLDGARLRDDFLLFQKPDLAPFAPITSLTLTRCEISLDHVALFVGACNSLEVFKLVWDTILFPNTEATEPFFRALQEHARSLRVLVVHLAGGVTANTPCGFLSLREFTRLDSLFLVMPRLGAPPSTQDLRKREYASLLDGFPRSLRRLYLIADLSDEDAVDVVSRLHEAARDGKLESLRELKVGTAVPTVPDISLPNMVSARLVRATVAASRKINDLWISRRELDIFMLTREWV
jgi:hypothetical protein